jgi:glutamate racemase
MKWCPGFLFVVVVVLSPSCWAPARPDSSIPIERVILEKKSDFYAIDFDIYKEKVNHLPVGVFDSGTGGLTVLDALLEYDEHTNESNSPGADGVPDFRLEKFIYLADQANMPYGNYYSENKTPLLIEHIIKDTQFLLSNKYYPSATSEFFKTDKEPVKTIVVACNTATAYGMDNIRAFIEKSQSNIYVIGVIDAGAKGALDVFRKDESGSIGVLATVGTIASGGYEKTLRRLIEESGYSGRIDIFNQGGHGIAEAVDEERDFIDRELRAPRQSYRGPSWDDPHYTIDKALLDVYNFDEKGLLCDASEVDDCRIIQLNSPENYVRYHLVSLLERIRSTPDAQPLKALLLGCTHYPYLTIEIRKVLRELYDYQEDGQYTYRYVLSPGVKLIDPAKNVAQELYSHLSTNQSFNPDGDMFASEFYISVPNISNLNVRTDSAGRFTYEYKYGRVPGELQEYVKVVPFSRETISDETFHRLEEVVPTTYKIISHFNRFSPKTSHLRANSEKSLVNRL